MPTSRRQARRLWLRHQGHGGGQGGRGGRLAVGQDGQAGGDRRLRPDLVVALRPRSGKERFEPERRGARAAFSRRALGLGAQGQGTLPTYILFSSEEVLFALPKLYCLQL